MRCLQVCAARQGPRTPVQTWGMPAGPGGLLHRQGDREGESRGLGSPRRGQRRAALRFEVWVCASCLCVMSLRRNFSARRRVCDTQGAPTEACFPGQSRGHFFTLIGGTPRRCMSQASDAEVPGRSRRCPSTDSSTSRCELGPVSDAAPLRPHTAPSIADRCCAPAHAACPSREQPEG